MRARVPSVPQSENENTSIFPKKKAGECENCRGDLFLEKVLMVASRQKFFAAKQSFFASSGNP
jgi:hypothetical protein